MKNLVILVPEGQNNLSSIVGSFKIFTRANDYLVSQGKKPLFNIVLAGSSKEITLYGGLFAVYPTLIKEVKHADLVIIPSLNKDHHNSVSRNREIITWIRDQYKNGAEIASICTGAFLLSATGLMDGKTCSTHWIAADAFRKMFPSVKVVTDKIITDEGGIYTNGGAYSFLNLVLYLVEKYYGRATAIFCSKVFQVDLDRYSQSPFTIFSGQKDHNDELVKRAQALIEDHYQERIAFEDLASELTISRRNFDRRFIRATGNTPVEYLQRVKIEAAKRLFESTRKTITEVMFDVGYTDPKAFRSIFRKTTGLSPLVYRLKYNKDPLLK